MIGLLRKARPVGPSDDDLVAQVADGAIAALGELYARHGAAAYRVAAAVCGDATLAETVVLDCFAALWRPDLRGGNRAEIGTVDRAAGVAAGLLSDVRRRAVARARWRTRRTTEQTRLASLPDAEHEVIVLSLYGGLTHAEIATLLGQSSAEVKTRMRSGLDKLRDPV